MDPILTLCKDILPRFLKTDLCTEFKKRHAECLVLPSANTLSIAPPAVDLSVYSREQDMTGVRRFGLAELLKEGFLYTEFLDFLQRRVCAESLYAYRAISLYEEAVTLKSTAEAHELGTVRTTI
jgi:hypothetical protein